MTKRAYRKKYASAQAMAAVIVKIKGETWTQWARRLFEFENCAECGRGVRGHLPAVVLGNWFALCREGR